MNEVYAVGVGPGSPEYLTKIVADLIKGSDIVIGYEYTLNTIKHLLEGKKVYTVTMKNQEDAYQEVLRIYEGKKILIPFTGDVNFSESEVVDRLIEIFGEVTLVPGISSVQVAAAKSRVPLDKTKVITFHVTSPIDKKKIELQKALSEGMNVIVIPRPWPTQPDKNFMPSDIALYLREKGFETEKIRVHVYEALTTPQEQVFEGTLNEVEGKEFSDLSVMVFIQSKLDSYMNYRWQWES